MARSERGEVELLRGLIRLANQLQSSLELDAIVHVIAMALSDTFGFREASVYLADACTGDVPRARHGRRAPRVRPRAVQPPRPAAGSGTSCSSRSTRSARPTSSTIASTSGPRSSSTIFRELDLGPRGPGEWHPGDDLLVPLYDKKRELMGVLDLYDPADRALPTLELVKSLEVFATHAAVAIENARQYEQLEHTTRGARGAAGPAARHDRGERGAPLDARRAHAPQPDRGAAQGDRRLRRDGDPARGRGRARAVLRLRHRRRLRAGRRAGARRSTSA